MSEQPVPYVRDDGSAATSKQVRVHHLQEMKRRGKRWAMLTAYDMYTARTFDEAGIPVITTAIDIPTVGIGAGPGCDAQVLVWQDMAGLRTGRLPRFVKQYADLHGTLTNAAKEYAAEVEAGSFPAPEHTFSP